MVHWCTAFSGVWSHCYFHLSEDLKVIPDDAGGCCKVGCCAFLDGLKGREGADAATARLDDVGCCDALPLSPSKLTSSLTVLCLSQLCT